MLFRRRPRKNGASVQKTWKQDLHTLKRVAHFFRPYRVHVVLILGIILITTALGVVSPLIIHHLIDDAIMGSDKHLLYIYVAMLVIIPVIAGFLSVGQTYVSNMVGQHVMRDFRNRLYSHLQNLSFSFFTSTRTGEIQSRLSNDVGGAQSAVTDTITRILTNIATVISTFIAMLSISPLLTLLSLGLLPIIVFITEKIGAIGRQNRKQVQQTLASLTALMQETLSVSGILLIKTFGRQRYAQARFEKENQQLTEESIRTQMVGRWFFMCVGIVLAITPALVYLVAGSQIIDDPYNSPITLGGMVAFISLQLRLLNPMAQLLNVQVEVKESLALFDRIFEYLDLPLEIQEKSDALSLPPEEVKGHIRFNNVSFTYKRAEAQQKTPLLLDINAAKGMATEKQSALVTSVESNVRPTLKNISFEIFPGQLAALVGPSGAGKSTITYLVPRLYDVDGGRVEIDGHNVQDITLSSLSESIGVVTQETYLFHSSVRENLLYARPEASEEDMVAAARAAAIHERILELEDGYDTIVGERGYKLSGGEKQRLAIARVLLKDPRILILDEATSSLDTHSERLIQAALEPLMKNRTTLAIAHRLSTVLAADIILVVNKGEIVERGTHQELLARGEWYAHLYHEQFSHQVSSEEGQAWHSIAKPTR